MERKLRIDKSREGTAKPTGKSGPRTWELEQYIYPEEPEDAKRSSHGDPRLEFALQSQHPDSDFIPHDEENDHEALHPAFGFGTTPDLSASDPSASELGTLAGDLRHAYGNSHGTRRRIKDPYGAIGTSWVEEARKSEAAFERMWDQRIRSRRR